ncbi:VapA/VapB family virulence-associated protein [Xenorhabdus hominickii]|uniref:Virulence associated protein VapA n=1 Tax=Xenorhabdus hominickii TaxID=351679 RepID=A0A2G0QGN2_XENHO|nr:VapA/VapB family virulence-associated protein [Xenorhabdus hominickii]AOM42349.1 hypothetical protein A9255_18365 [Xenorhabdus hominickii]PHM58358.1 hypothetical protein Xhom_01380 [Xenorhabdus hominickii]
MSSKFNENELKLKTLKKFSTDMQGRLEQNKIDEIIKEFILNEKNYLYKGKLTIVSYVFYSTVELAISTEWTFYGNGGAVGLLEVGSYRGALYTSDYDKLLVETHSFWYSSSLTSISLILFDKHNSYLGNFVGSGVSLVASIGKGLGAWDAIE